MRRVELTPTRAPWYVACIVFFAVLAVFASGRADALEFVVDRTEDRVGVNLGNGLCDSDGVDGCTLRAAIMEANEIGGSHSILLTQDLSPNMGGRNENLASTGDFDILANISIESAVPGVVFEIDALGLGDRAFHVMNGASLRLEGVRLYRGVATNAEQLAPVGGAILVEPGGELELHRVEITASVAFAGGAVYNEGHALVSDSLFRWNAVRRIGNTLPESMRVGSAILSTGSLRIVASTLQDNGRLGQQSCQACTLNDAAIHVMDLGAPDPSLQIDASTIANNHHGVIVDAVPTTITHGTIAGNDLGGLTFVADLNQPGAILLEVLRTVVVGNESYDCLLVASAPDLAVSGGRNASGDTSCGFDSDGDYESIVWPFTDDAPQLQGVPDTPSGHPLPILIPDPLGALVDAGGLACAGTDQRGVTRPQDGDLDGDAYCDIGAVEYRADVDPLQSFGIFMDGFEQ